jgi:hypothetical protein
LKSYSTPSQKKKVGHQIERENKNREAIYYVIPFANLGLDIFIGKTIDRSQVVSNVMAAKFRFVREAVNERVEKQ